MLRENVTEEDPGKGFHLSTCLHYYGIYSPSYYSFGLPLLDIFLNPL